MQTRLQWNAGVIIACLLAWLSPAFSADTSATLEQAPARKSSRTVALDGIAATLDENGRKVYTNAAPVREDQAKLSGTSARRASVLVYWSNTEHRWKPVPPPSPSAMRAARSAAAEVERTVVIHPPSATGLPARVSCLGDCRSQIDAAIEKAAARNHVDPNLVRAVIKVESNFNPQAVSSKGAMGLMQLMPETARQLKVSHPFDPQENVDGGVRHLRGLLDDFGGDVKLSLAAYNAGESAVLRHGGIPDYPETRNYVKQITNFYGEGMGTRGWASRGFSEPIQVFRGSNGVLTITSE